jgi:hypothetical protein
MVNKQAIYQKTLKGSEAIANRQSGLAPKLRSLLIMVDGKRTYAELAVMAAALGDPERLSELEAEGLVESAFAEDRTLPAALEPVTQPTETEAPQRAANLAQAQRFSSHLLEHTLGPMAEPLCIKIEKAGNLADFVAAIKRAREIVREIKGNAEAERFVAQIEAQMPPG